jgi:hypothetical protein
LAAGAAKYAPLLAAHVLWILHQNPDATLVASYKTWQIDLGYQVRAKQVGLKIWVPRHRKVKEVDSETGEEVDAVRTSFGLGTVFDRSQVDPIPGKAKPLGLSQPGPIDGDSHDWALPALERYAEGLGYEVKRVPLPPGQSGFQDRSKGVIGLGDDLAANGEVQVLIHEEGHALGIDYRRFGRRRAEAIVECAAYVVCARIGLDVSVSAVPYVASWAKEEASVIERDAREIDRIARAILDGADLEREEAARKAPVLAAA